MDDAAVVVLDVVLVLEVVLVVLGVIVVTVNGGSASQIKNVECAAFVFVVFFIGVVVAAAASAGYEAGC